MTALFSLVPSPPDEPHTTEDGEREEYAWCWIACPHDPPCAASPEARDE